MYAYPIGAAVAVEQMQEWRLPASVQPGQEAVVEQVQDARRLVDRIPWVGAKGAAGELGKEGHVCIEYAAGFGVEQRKTR